MTNKNITIDFEIDTGRFAHIADRLALAANAMGGFASASLAVGGAIKGIAQAAMEMEAVFEQAHNIFIAGGGTSGEFYQMYSGYCTPSRYTITGGLPEIEQPIPMELPGYLVELPELVTATAAER